MRGRIILAVLMVAMLVTGLAAPLSAAPQPGTAADKVSDDLYSRWKAGEISDKEYDRLAPVQSCSPEAAWPGPDGFGYMGSAVAYNWVDITTSGTPITGLTDDNYVGPFPIGFNFFFYGAAQTDFYAASNGYFLFGAGYSSLSNQCPLPNSSQPDNIVSMLWDDLNFNTSGNAYYQTFSPCPVGVGQCTVVEYYNVAHYGGAAGSAGTWETILYEDGSLIIQFLDAGVEEGSSSTTGIEGNDAAADWGLTYACNVAATITDGLAIQFTPPAPAPRYDDSSKQAPGEVLPGEPIDYTITIYNSGNAPGLETSMVDPIPAGTIYNGDVACSSGTCSFDGTNVVWNGQVAAPPKEVAGQARVVEASRSVELKLEATGGASVQTNPPVVNAPVSLVLDDGSVENNIGLGGTIEMLWVNRFTPDPAEFPFDLTEVQVYFDATGLVNVGDDMVLVVYENTSGNNDPAVGSNFLAAYNVTVQALNAWNVYTLPSAVTFAGPGDAIVGVIGMETPGTSYWPAAIDQTATQARSWAGWWNSSPPPTPPTLPPPNWTLIDAYFPGNWMVRGYGETSAQPPENPVIVTFSVTPDNPPCGATFVNEATISDPAALEPVIVSASTDVVNPPYYAQDFEANDGGYVNMGTNLFTWGPPPQNQAHSGVNAWATDMPYVSSAWYELWSPWIDLTGANPINDLVLSWWQDIYIESASWDHAYVEITTDETNWAIVWQHSGGTYHSPGWEKKTGDITPYIGQVVRLRFRMTSDSSVQYDGWAIDDVSIASGCQVFLYPDIEVSPAELNATLCPDQVETQQLTICNVGEWQLDWTLGEVPAPRGASIPRFTGQIPAPDVAGTSIGRAPDAASASPAEIGKSVAQMVGEPAYAVDVYPGYNLVTFANDNPGVWTVIAGLPGSQYFAGDFIGCDYGALYVIDYGTNSLYTVDTATGAVTLIGPSTPYGGESWTGMTGSMDGTMYASSTNISRSTLYTVDLGTGAATVVGEITNAPAIIDIAITPEGDMYGVDIVNDNLVQIDPATGAGTVIGYIGFNANYAQGMDYEEESGTLYLAAYNGTSSQGELRIADPATGNTVLVGAFPGGAEVDSLAFATCGVQPDIPWLSENPTSGTVPIGECQVVDVIFDSTGLGMGTYAGALKIMSNDPDEPRIDVPVTLTVQCGDLFTHVGFIHLRYVDRGFGKYTERAQVQILDNFGGFVPDATVYVEWTLPDGNVVPQSNTTRPIGEAAFKVNGWQQGTFQLCVTNVAKAGYVYDPASNFETCDWITVP